MNVSDGDRLNSFMLRDWFFVRKSRNKDSPMSAPLKILIDNLSKLRTIEHNVLRAAKSFIGTEIEENKVLKGLKKRAWCENVFIFLDAEDFLPNAQRRENRAR